MSSYLAALEDTCCQCRTRYDQKKKYGSFLPSSFPFEKEGCTQCKIRNTEWIWLGYTSVNVHKTAWIRVNPETGNNVAVDAPKVAELSDFTALEFPKHITKLPSWVCDCIKLEALNLVCCENVQSLPIAEILNLPNLKVLDCKGCSKLYYPPQEVCKQGGTAVMRFLQEVNGQVSTNMNLFLIGEGEAGKTSVVIALKSSSNSAYHIRADHRTIGIDITSWQPKGSDVVFDIYDLAGQAVYSKTHQLFLLRRAVYLFVWRAGNSELQSLQQTILYWLNSLQNRVPGSYILLVVTHIDQVSGPSLESQCAAVQICVSEWLKNCKQKADSFGTHVPVILNDGASFKVNCLLGSGIDVLRQSVIDFVTSMPWYKEGMPSSWIDLQARLSEKRHQMKPPYLSLLEYKKMARSCGVHDGMIQSATTFLHDSGVIRYFGNWQEPLGSERTLLSSTVFISPSWMMQILKGLIRHDMQALQNFFLKGENKTFLRYVNKLTTFGFLHEDMIPFLWPSQPKSDQFWRLIRENERGEQLWPEDIIETIEESELAVALLEGFDLVVKVGSEYVVPGVLPPAMLPSMTALDTIQCPFRFVSKYVKLPSGAFDTLVVRLIKKHQREFDFAATHASFFEGEDIMQLFVWKPEASAIDQMEEWLVVQSTSNALLEDVEVEVENIERFYPGLSCLGKTKSSQADQARVDNVLAVSKVSECLPEIAHPFTSSHIACVHCKKSDAFCKQMLLDEFKTIEYDTTNVRVTCLNCQYEHQLYDLVTTYRIGEIRQCPFCFGDENARGKFHAGECRLKQSCLNGNSSNNVTCTKCLAAGRLGKVSIFEVAPAEVYVSGFTQLQTKSQTAIDLWLRHLEIEADICCSKENPGLDYALVVLAFLSEEYFISNQCVEELAAAVTTNKCIIPIVIASSMISTPSQPSWTGNEHDPFWQAIEEACTRKTADNYCIQLKFLKNVKPMLFELGEPNPGNLIPTVASKIQLHIQRPGKIELYADFSMLGIKLSYFETFVHRYGGRKVFENLTTLETMEKIIKPATQESRLSFCELLLSENAFDCVGKAEWFYSHAWKYRFLDAMDAAALFFQDQSLEGKDPIIWFDVFSVSQHKAEIRPFEWWNSAFLNAVGSIGKVLMLIQPFEDETTDTCAWVTLTRVWCVFELFACESTLSRFEVTMTKNMRDMFLQSLRQNDEKLLKSLVDIKCEDCKAFKEEDQNRVFEVINRTIGFPLLDSMVLQVMERWIYSELFKQMKVNPASNPLKIMKKFCESCKSQREKTLNADHADTIRSKHLLGCITRAMNEREYLQSLISREFGLAKDAEDMTKAELEEMVKRHKAEAKSVSEQEATKRGQALLAAERAQLEAEEKARLEAEEKARLEAEEKARLEAEVEARLKEIQSKIFCAGTCCAIA
eukprot:CAMPEP_0172198962 /NCGR_PEP_ID=MMETSP1050-20130122/28407_1 /TAXON_ID=233186 /ORGANISM="Cryptomonas curvata, Strain CCAP979/52" /LENGTH=1402 /DNA_ID=CAMNT_0012875899 /DNA_START=67 /DNA_END=4275 /DNA_ORIENTATION=-